MFYPLNNCIPEGLSTSSFHILFRHIILRRHYTVERVRCVGDLPCGTLRLVAYCSAIPEGHWHLTM